MKINFNAPVPLVGQSVKIISREVFDENAIIENGSPRIINPENGMDYQSDYNSEKFGYEGKVTAVKFYDKENTYTINVWKPKSFSKEVNHWMLESFPVLNVPQNITDKIADVLEKIEYIEWKRTASGGGERRNIKLTDRILLPALMEDGRTFGFALMMPMTKPTFTIEQFDKFFHGGELYNNNWDASQFTHVRDEMLAKKFGDQLAEEYRHSW